LIHKFTRWYMENAVMGTDRNQMPREENQHVQAYPVKRFMALHHEGRPLAVFLHFEGFAQVDKARPYGCRDWSPA
jgi:hypothetical protein